MKFRAFCPHCKHFVIVEFPLPTTELMKAIDQHCGVMIWHRAETGEDHEWYVDATGTEEIKELLRKKA